MIGILLVMILMLYSVSNLIIVSSFNDLEEKALDNEIDRAEQILANEINQLDKTNSTWATWDTTYQFMQYHNQSYIDTNLTDMSMNLSGLDFMFFYNNDGNCVFGKINYPNNIDEAEFSRILNVSLQNSQFTKNRSIINHLAGILALSDSPVLLSSCAIVDSGNQRPVLGTLVSGRILTQEIILDISKHNNVSIDVLPVQSKLIPAYIANKFSNLQVFDTKIRQIVSDKNMSGYTGIRDIYGNPTLILQVNTAREIYSQSKMAFNIFMGALLFVGLIFMVLILLYVDSSVLVRVRQLNQSITSIGQNGDISSRVPVSGTDELAGFATELNNMLDKLEQSQTDLQESKNLYATIVEKSNDGIAIVEDGLFKFANNRLTEMLKYKSAEVVGKPMLTFIHPDYKEKTFEYYRRRISGQSAPDKYEIAVLAKDGDTLYIELSARVIELDKKPVDIIIVRDVTERKQMEEQLMIADRLASVGELASGIAHEINNPLTGVVGFSQLLMNEKLPEPVKNDIATINREAKRAAEVIKNLLIFSRKHQPEIKPIDINEIIKNVLSLRAYEHKISNIHVMLFLASNLPKAIGDYYQIQQVFINLITNAEYSMLKANKGGNLAISTSKTAAEKIKITFSDDGIGISKEHLNHIFDPFFTTKDVGKGTGLGLSICHGIIAKHNGTIICESKNQNGASFIIELPYIQD
jgi:PAS domain S-box-containing protein